MRQIHALPDDGTRYEVAHGELLVSPGPVLSHQEWIRPRVMKSLDSDQQALRPDVTTAVALSRANRRPVA